MLRHCQMLTSENWEVGVSQYILNPPPHQLSSAPWVLSHAEGSDMQVGL